MIPKHVAIIPDGNRRWAKEKGFVESFGHKVGGEYNNLRSLCEEIKKYGTKYLSVWAFSTENWKRDKREKYELFDVISRGVDRFADFYDINKYKIKQIGRKDRLPKKLIDKIDNLEKLTSNYSDFNVLLGIDYGGRDEILRAVNEIINKGKDNMDEDTFKKYLDTGFIPDPEILVRTGGEQRMSGFLPFQATYSELFFVDKYFPDFDSEDIKKIFQEYNDRNRKFGK